MSHEERFVACNVFHTYDTVRSYGNDFVNKLHGVAMRQQLANANVVQQRLFVGVVNRSLYLVFTNLLAHESGKLVVYGMSWTSGNDASLDGLAYKCHVTDDVQKFVTGTLILPHQRFVLNVTNLGSIHVGNF